MSDDDTSPGARAFAAFLAEHGFTQVAAGAALGVSGPTIHDWASGAKRPRAHHRSAIEIWSRGAVPASIWDTDEERARVANVEPFTPAGNDADRPPRNGTEG